MKDLFVGLSTAFTAVAAIVMALFEFVFRDVKDLRDEIKRKDPDLGPGKAEEKAVKKRRKQKLWILFPLLVIAFGCSLAALFISESSDSGSAPPRPHLQRP